jgi:hypothetical protein
MPCPVAPVGPPFAARLPQCRRDFLNFVFGLFDKIINGLEFDALGF